MFLKLLPLLVGLSLCAGSEHNLLQDQLKENLDTTDSLEDPNLWLWAINSVSTLSQICIIRSKTDDLAPDYSKEQVQKFLMVGDFGDYKHKENIDGMTDIMSQLAAQDTYDFILTVGDNFYPDGIESMDDLDLPDNIMSFFQKDNIRDLKMFPILGNHDCFSDYYNQILYSDYNEQWEMESDYYELKYNLKDDPSKYLVILMTNTCLLACNTSFDLPLGDTGSD